MRARLLQVFTAVVLAASGLLAQKRVNQPEAVPDGEPQVKRVEQSDARSADSNKRLQIFGDHPGHRWDGLRETVRNYKLIAADEPVQPEVLEQLEAVQKLAPQELELQPPMRRLIFIRELWRGFNSAKRDFVRRPIARIMTSGSDT
jgi:hypothetical protein